MITGLLPLQVGPKVWGQPIMSLGNSSLCPTLPPVHLSWLNSSECGVVCLFPHALLHSMRTGILLLTPHAQQVAHCHISNQISEYMSGLEGDKGMGNASGESTLVDSGGRKDIPGGMT